MKKRAKIIRVLISGVGGGSHGLEIMKALRQSELDYRINAADMNPRSLGLYCADKAFCVPAATEAGYVPTLLRICRKEKIQVLIHGSEPDLKALSDNRDRFEQEGVFMPFNSKEVIDLCLNKKETCAFFKREGIAHPQTVIINAPRDSKNVRFLPAVVKPYLGAGGSQHVFIAQNKEELNFFCRYLLRYHGYAMVQEYIGSPDNEYTIGILSGHEGGIISAIAIKRNIAAGMSNRYKVRSLHNSREYLAVSSGVSQGEVVAAPAIISQCIHIAKAIHSRGPINIQCRVVAGVVMPFEINPRFSGTTYLRALAGINEPDLLIRKYIIGRRLAAHYTPQLGLVVRGMDEMFIPRAQVRR